MILVTTATELELQPLLLKRRLQKGDSHILTEGQNFELLITGIGPVAAAISLFRRLVRGDIDCVLNFGVGGAYLQQNGAPQPELLDLCLATREMYGDLGVCMSSEILYFENKMTGPLEFSLDKKLLEIAQASLVDQQANVHRGNFVTVSSASGTKKRGEFLHNHWNGLCENMEGASIAQVCAEFKVPLVEVRAISNYVVDRDRSSWKLNEASEVAAGAADILIEEFTHYAK